MRWGIVGFGWAARDHMAPGIVAAGDIIDVVCDPDARAREAAACLGAQTTADLDVLIGKRLDAVYVATPNHLHRGAVVACLEAGVPVLCEKPLAADLADAQAMVAGARRTGTLFGSAFDQRYHPAHVAIREAIVAGLVGVPTAVRIVYCCWLGKDWLGLSDNWRIDAARAGGGAVMDLAPHGLDLAVMLVGEPLVALTGMLQRRVQDYAVDDGGMLVGRTASGILVSLHNSYNTPETLPRRRLEIIGTRGAIVADDTMGQDAGGSVRFIDARTGAARPLPFDAVLSPFTQQARAFAAAVRGEPHDFDPWRDLAAMALLLAVAAGPVLENA